MSQRKPMQKASDAPRNPTKEIGASGQHITTGWMFDEFLPELRGNRAIRKYREMRDNDPIIGAILQAMDMMMRSVQWRAEPSDSSPAAQEGADFVDSLWDDMEGSFDEYISQTLSFLVYGWSASETIYKRRSGQRNSGAPSSMYRDGKIGLHKLSHRPQPSLDRWKYDENDNLEAMVQSVPGRFRSVEISMNKLIHVTTTSATGSPSGRSILRNAYRAYYFATHIENIEGIAIERELNGLPVAYVPTEMLTATDGPLKTAREKYEQILRDVKRNEQGYILLPSDPYEDADGKISSQKMVEFKLVASEGTRDIDTGAVIVRYRQDMARTVLADFVMLGQGDRGSFALSKSKSDLFLRSLEGYLGAIGNALNKQLLPRVWALNGMNFEHMPTMTPGRVAPVDLAELGDYVQKLAGAGFPIFPDQQIEERLLQSADLPSDQRDDVDLLGREAND